MILGNPTLWEKRDKVPLRNIEIFSRCYESYDKKSWQKSNIGIQQYTELLI